MEELTSNKKKKYKLIRIILQITLMTLFIAFLIFLTVKIYPIFNKIQKNEEYRNEVIEILRGYGGWVSLIIIGAQILQSILAVIPSGPIVMIAGVLCHPAHAIILCIIGQTLGSICVYYLVKVLGYRFIALFMDPDKIKQSKLLKNTKRCEVLMFGYLLIPALPKDIVSFVAPLTNIKVKNFILINLIARIPMTIVTVFMGSSLISGAYYIAIILAIFSLLLAIICFVFNGKIIKFLEKHQDRNIEKEL